MKNVIEDGHVTQLVVRDGDKQQRFATHVVPERGGMKGHSGTAHTVDVFGLENTVEGLVSRGIPVETINAGAVNFVPDPTPERTIEELKALRGDVQRARSRRSGRDRQQGRPGRGHTQRRG